MALTQEAYEEIFLMAIHFDREVMWDRAIQGVKEGVCSRCSPTICPQPCPMAKEMVKRGFINQIFAKAMMN